MILKSPLARSCMIWERRRKEGLRGRSDYLIWCYFACLIVICVIISSCFLILWKGEDLTGWEVGCWGSLLLCLNIN